MSGRRFAYLAIPVGSVDRLAATSDFYEALFGWQQQGPPDFDNHHFSDQDGIFSGAYMTDRQPPNRQGSILYIVVEDGAATMAKVQECIKSGPPDSKAEILSSLGKVDMRNAVSATFRDPAGNVIGIYQNLPA